MNRREFRLRLFNFSEWFTFIVWTVIGDFLLFLDLLHKYAFLFFKNEKIALLWLDISFGRYIEIIGIKLTLLFPLPSSPSFCFTLLPLLLHLFRYLSKFFYTLHQCTCRSNYKKERVVSTICFASFYLYFLLQDLTRVVN